jgi:hypothetical protein
MLLGSVQLQAKEYAIKDIPMVHLQNRTRYVSNPDGILSSTAVTTMDIILYALEQKTGIFCNLLRAEGTSKSYIKNVISCFVST